MDSETYQTLRKFISHNQYRARLFKLKPVGKSGIQITIYKIKNKGLKAFDEIRDIQLSPIDINAPGSRFEIGIVKAYNDCRRKYLHQYLGTLTGKQIQHLMKDNYIQKKDVLKLLKH